LKGLGKALDGAAKTRRDATGSHYLRQRIKL
jgi:hypothetical protein